MTQKQKYYVVWAGVVPGIYTSWNDCKRQVQGIPAAKYKSFETLEAAEQAYTEGAQSHLRSRKTQSVGELLGRCIDSVPHTRPIEDALAVDAACSGNPGKVEYRGVFTKDATQAFHVGPMEMGTNNIGEFLAIVHGLAFLKQHNSNMPIYSDSANAIAWVRQKKCKTKLERTARNAYLFELVDRAEKWLKTNTYTTLIHKWETSQWGEIPADFGRKKQ